MLAVGLGVMLIHGYVSMNCCSCPGADAAQTSGAAFATAD